MPERPPIVAQPLATGPSFCRLHSGRGKAPPSSPRLAAVTILMQPQSCIDERHMRANLRKFPTWRLRTLSYFSARRPTSFRNAIRRSNNSRLHTAAHRWRTRRTPTPGQIYRVPTGVSVTTALAAHGVRIPVSCENGVIPECAPAHWDHGLTSREKAKNDRFTPCCSRAICDSLPWMCSAALSSILF